MTIVIVTIGIIITQAMSQSLSRTAAQCPVEIFNSLGLLPGHAVLPPSLGGWSAPGVPVPATPTPADFSLGFRSSPPPSSTTWSLPFLGRSFYAGVSPGSPTLLQPSDPILDWPDALTKLTPYSPTALSARFLPSRLLLSSWLLLRDQHASNL